MKGDAGRDDRARRGSTPKAEDTRRRILAAALDLFQERGFAETTMRHIARKADVEAKSTAGFTALLFAARQGHLDVVRELVKAGADVNQTAPAGTPVLNLALENLRYDVASFLTPGMVAAHNGRWGDCFPLDYDHVGGTATDGIDPARLYETLEGSGARIPADLAPHLPLLLWLYQMGVILFWIHDRSPRQTRTQRLLDHSLDLIVRAIQVSRFPLLTPIRKAALRLVTVVTDPTLPEEAR